MLRSQAFAVADVEFRRIMNFWLVEVCSHHASGVLF